MDNYDCYEICIIDADLLIYRCGFSVEKRNKETEVIEIEPLENAIHNLNSMLARIKEKIKALEYKMYLTASKDKTNFRYAIYPEYKANRKDVRRPVYYEELRQHLVNLGAEIAIGEEADDACSIKHCEYLSSSVLNLTLENNIASIVCSFDKDFNNIPGYHYNYVKDEVYFVNEIQALRNFYLQILTGDTSDGIPRIKKGWRQKNAEKLIQAAQTEKNLINIVKDEIEKVLFTESKERSLTKGQVKEFVKEEITWRGQLVWLRREKNQMWTIPGIS